MKPVSLTESESVVIGTKFEYVEPEAWSDIYSSDWQYPVSKVEEGDLPILKSLEEKHLVAYMCRKDWPSLVDEDCWVFTDNGRRIYEWFHSFPENYGC